MSLESVDRVLEEKSKYYIRLAVSSVLHVVLYHVGIFISLFLMLLFRNSIVQVQLYYIFYLIPLQIVLMRKGRNDFLLMILISFILLFIFRIYMASSVISGLKDISTQAPGSIPFSKLSTVVFPMILIELVTLASLVIGLAVINLFQHEKWGMLYKLLGVTAGAALVGILMVLALNTDKTFVETMQKLFLEVFQYFRTLMAELPDLKEPLVEEGIKPLIDVDPSLLLKGFWHYVLGGFIFGYFTVLSFSWYFGSILGNRSLGRTPRIIRLSQVRLPDFFVWPLIAFWTIILLSRFVDFYGIDIVAWNGGFVFLALFGLQGLGILRFLMDRYQVLKRINMLFFVIIFIVLIFPPLMIILFVLIPGLGVSEIWIKYRVDRKEKDEL